MNKYRIEGVISRDCLSGIIGIFVFLTENPVGTFGQGIACGHRSGKRVDELDFVVHVLIRSIGVLGETDLTALDLHPGVVLHVAVHGTAIDGTLHERTGDVVVFVGTVADGHIGVAHGVHVFEQIMAVNIRIIVRIVNETFTTAEHVTQIEVLLKIEIVIQLVIQEHVVETDLTATDIDTSVTRGFHQANVGNGYGGRTGWIVGRCLSPSILTHVGRLTAAEHRT